MSSSKSPPAAETATGPSTSNSDGVTQGSGARSESNRHAFKGGAFSATRLAPPRVAVPPGFVVWSTPLFLARSCKQAVVLRKANREIPFRTRRSLRKRYSDQADPAVLRAGWRAQPSCRSFCWRFPSRTASVRFCHSCALVPKYRDNRSAISAVIARRRRAISLTVGAATPSSFATL